MADEPLTETGLNAGKDQPVSGESAVPSASNPTLFNDFSQLSQQIIRQLIIAGGGGAFSSISGIKPIFTDAAENKERHKGLDLLIQAQETARSIERLGRELLEMTEKIVKNIKDIGTTTNQIISINQEAEETAKNILNDAKNNPGIAPEDAEEMEESSNAFCAVQDDLQECAKKLDGNLNEAVIAAEDVNNICGCPHSTEEEKQNVRDKYIDSMDQLHTTIDEVLTLQREHGQHMRAFISKAKETYTKLDPEHPMLEEINKLEGLVNEAQALRMDLEKLAEGGKNMTPEYLEKAQELGLMYDKFEEQVGHLPEKDQEALAPIISQFEKPTNIIEAFHDNQEQLFAGAANIAAATLEHYNKLLAENERVTALRDEQQTDLTDMKTGLQVSQTQLTELATIDTMQAEIIAAIKESDASNRAAFINDQFGGGFNFHVKLNATNHFSRYPKSHVTTPEGNVVFTNDGKYFAEVKNENGKVTGHEEITDQAEITKLQHQAWVDGKPFGNETRYGERFGEGFLTSLFGSKDKDYSQTTLEEAASETRKNIATQENQIETLKDQIAEQQEHIVELGEKIKGYTAEIAEQAPHIAEIKNEVETNKKYGLEGESLAIQHNDSTAPEPEVKAVAAVPLNPLHSHGV